MLLVAFYRIISLPPFLFNIFINILVKGMEKMVIKFANNSKLKGRTNVLDDTIKIQNDLDKAEH